MRAELANVVVGTATDNLSAAGTDQATAYVLTLDDEHIFRTVPLPARERYFNI